MILFTIKWDFAYHKVNLLVISALTGFLCPGHELKQIIGNNKNEQCQ